MTPYRKKEFYQGGYYHIYNRGVNREPIFFNDDNYKYCLKMIRKYLDRYNLCLIVYCLMPNHYHFIIRQESEAGISDFIRDVFNTYAQAVNKRQHRTGTLFQGRFKHIHIERDEHILHLCRYIHLNPVKAGLVVSPEFWRHSNYADWIGLRAGTLTDRSFMMDNFGNSENYRAFVIEYLQEKTVEKMIGKYMFDD